MVNAANVEEIKESEYVDGFKASCTELLLVDKGNYREVVWDTASVLQEAFQCIRFLHQQIKVLSSAYMEARAESAMEQVWRVVAEGDLRRRGLCLVPVSSMLSAACTPASFEH
ncbi:Transcription factor bHLH123 [Platanthera guangdongensis]|uniref:Transcription factor bHLH123 n=1 Tax=Platanthera guangdongensis TaxID=2320717 RepID=A0ABR2LJX7_9ASPA